MKMKAEIKTPTGVLRIQFDPVEGRKKKKLGELSQCWFRGDGTTLWLRLSPGYTGSLIKREGLKDAILEAAKEVT